MSRFVSALIIVLLTCSVVTAADTNLPSFDGVPKHSVSRWIRYEILGPRNHPFPIFYISTRRFKPTTMIEFQVVLPRPRYNIVARFTQSRMARGDCESAPNLNNWYTVQILEHDGDRTQQCVLPQVSACKYLSGVVGLPGVDWADEELKLITSFVGEVRCEAKEQS
jgi:hypothetical protein